MITANDLLEEMDMKDDDTEDDENGKKKKKKKKKDGKAEKPGVETADFYKKKNNGENESKAQQLLSELGESE